MAAKQSPVAFAKGKWRTVQICLVCKAAGRAHVALTLADIVSHINTEHAEGTDA